MAFPRLCAGSRLVDISHLTTRCISLLNEQAIVSGINATDDKGQEEHLLMSIVVSAEREGTEIPLDRYSVKQPVFFAAARHDYISRSVLGIAMTHYNCPEASIREFNAGHWLMISHPTEVNASIFNWIMDLV